MLLFKNVIFTLISPLTLYIGNVYFLPPKRGSRPTPPPTLPFLRPCHGLVIEALTVSQLPMPRKALRQEYCLVVGHILSLGWLSYAHPAYQTPPRDGCDIAVNTY